LVLMVSCSQATHAALPPSAYPDPRNASEDLDVKVLRVSRRMTEINTILIRWDVKVHVEVREVRRTSTDLQWGSRIVICYSAFRYIRPGRTGPSSQPILSRGEVWSAALNVVGDNKDRCYIPGGAPYSTFLAPAKKN